MSRRAPVRVRRPQRRREPWRRRRAGPSSRTWPPRRRRPASRSSRRSRSRCDSSAGLSSSQKDAFAAAADRWTKVIVGDLPSVRIGDEVIDDVLIIAQGKPIDGVGKILGQAGPTHLRPANAGAAAFLPARGTMVFDSADLAAMQSRGTLKDVITHEMGHVLGIGTIWDVKRMLKGPGTQNPTFDGASAKKSSASSSTRRPRGSRSRTPAGRARGTGTGARPCSAPSSCRGSSRNPATP